jgi:spore germination protein KA
MVSFFKQKGQMKKRKKQKIDEKEKDQSIIKTPQNIDSSITANLDIVKQKTGSSPDIIIRTLKTSQNPENKVSICMYRV